LFIFNSYQVLGEKVHKMKVDKMFNMNKPEFMKLIRLMTGEDKDILMKLIKITRDQLKDHLMKVK